MNESTRTLPGPALPVGQPLPPLPLGADPNPVIDEISRLLNLLPQAADPAPLRAEIDRLTKQLPETDGVPLESPWHVAVPCLLIQILTYLWRDRDDYYTGGNMFVYYSEHRRRNEDFRGPDFFFTRGVERRRPRDFWAVWQEGDKFPEMIIEFLSPTTAREDRTTKKALYQDIFHTQEYYCFDPTTCRLEGWRLAEGKYRDIAADERGWMWSEVLGLWLGTWVGEFQGVQATWPRFYHPDGQLVLRDVEAEHQRAEAERQRAEAERQRAEEAQQSADAQRQRAEAAEAELARLKALLAQQGQPPPPNPT